MSSYWNSLTANGQALAFSLALGSLALLFLLALCCICCRRNGSRRRKNSRNGTMMRGAMQQESASSMLSGSVAHQHQQQQQKMPLMPGGGNTHMLVQQCNGGSTIAGSSDLNSAFYRKVRDERMRAAVAGGDEMLNPLLHYGTGGASMEQHLQMVGYPTQQQMFEKHAQQTLPQQQFRTYWETTGTLNSASAAAYPTAYYAPTQQQPQSLSHSQPAYSSPHTSTEPPPAEPYQIAHIQEQQLRFHDRILGEDASTQLIQGDWVGGMISGAALQVVLLPHSGGIFYHYPKTGGIEDTKAKHAAHCGRTIP